MKLNQKGRDAAFVAIISALVLSGCLSKEEQNTGFSGNGNEVGTQNGAPSISGSPQEAVMMGREYVFTPTASDPDGDSLSFSVTNLPVWASFDATTGRLSGQPSLADVGVFGGVVISVSDGRASASLPEFSVTVTQAALGSMSLSWTPPTENTDGSVLTNLAGYNIYYGTTQGSYPNKVKIDDAGLSAYVVENLLPDTYYVVATSFNSAGIESARSNVAVREVNGG